MTLADPLKVKPSLTEGAKSIKRIPKIFRDHSPSLKKGPRDEKVGISYLKVIIKFPLPYFIRKLKTTDFIYLCRWPLSLLSESSHLALVDTVSAVQLRPPPYI